MSNPVESYLKEFGQQSEDPVADYLKSYGPPQHLAVGQPEPVQPQGSMLGDIARGIGDAATEVVKGTAQFAGQLTAPYFTPPVSDRLKPQAPPEVPSGAELLKDAVTAPFEMIGHGTVEALNPASTTRQKAHGAASAIAGGLGIAGGLKGISEVGKGLKGPKGPVERIQAAQATQTEPITPAEGTSALGKAKTPEERQAVVEQMTQQGEAVAKAQGEEKIKKLKAIQTWSTLSPEQRTNIVPGLATPDYAKTWKELTPEGRKAIRRALNLEESGTNLDTSPIIPSVPAAQGATPEVQGTIEEGTPLVSTPEASAFQPPADASDVGMMDVNSLRAKRVEALEKLSKLKMYERHGPSVIEGQRPEQQFWTKYLDDIETELAKRLAPGGEKQQASVESVSNDPQLQSDLEAMTPDIAPLETAGQEHLGKRYVNPDNPQMSALISKNTKAGGKPYRVTYFVKDAEGKTDYYVHNEFDTAQEAHDYITGPAQPGDIMGFKGIKSSDKLQGYVEEVTDRKAVAAAIKGTDGKTYTGRLHSEAFDKMPEGTAGAESKMGYVNKAGQFFENNEGPLKKTTEYDEGLKAAAYENSSVGDAGASAKEPPNAPNVGGPAEASQEGGTDAPSRAEGTHETSKEPPELTALYDELDALSSEAEDLRVADIDGSGNPARMKEILKRLVDIHRRIAQYEVTQPVVSYNVRPDPAGTNLWLLQGLDKDGNVVGKPELFPTKAMAEQGAIHAKMLRDSFDKIDKQVNETNKETGQLQDDLTLMREGVEPLDVERMDKIEQSIKDQGTIEKFLKEPAMDQEQIDAHFDALDAKIDRLDAMLDKGDIDLETYEKQLYQISESKKWLRSMQAPGETNFPKPVQKFKMPDTVGKDLNKFSADQLSNSKKSIGALLRSPDIAKLPEAKVLRDEIDRILDYEAEIKRQSEGPAGPALSQRKIDVEGLPKYEQYFSKKVVTGASFKNPFNWIKFIRNQYQGWVRQSHSGNFADRLFEAKTNTHLPAHESTGKLMEMPDAHLDWVEEYLRGQGPFVPDGQGGTVRTGAKSLADILVNTARSDLEKFGWVWAARRALDLKALRNRDVGIDLGYAQEMVVNSPQHLHQAVDEVRQYHTSLSEFGVITELISRETAEAFKEESAYGPFQWMYGPEEVISKISKLITTTGKSAAQIVASQPFQRLRGQGKELLLRNMVESTVDFTYRMLRSAHLQQVALSLVEKMEKEPKLYEGIIDPLGHRQQIAMSRENAARTEAVKAMFKEHGMDVTNEHANLFANLLTDDALRVTGGVLKVYRDGKIKAYQLDDLMAESFRSLAPPEMNKFVKMMGTPAGIARKGIVLYPRFVLDNAVIDQFQIWFNTRYGFNPVIDGFKGWWNIVNNSEAFHEAQRAGGIEKGSLRGRVTIGDILAGPAKAPLPLARQQFVSGHPWRAYKTLIGPIREAGRMGEYLKARGHGETPISAAWAARDVAGNYSIQGAFATARALNHMALFLGPAISVTDKVARTIKERPVQWFAKGAVSMAAISYLLHLANDGDDRIDQLRQTPGGQRWWYVSMRPVSDQILQFRKPYFEGAVFASGFEAFLDYWKGTNPEAFQLWRKSMLQEVSLNMLPTAGVVPAEIWFNEDLHTGAPIVSDQEQGLDPELQSGNSGIADRIIAKHTGIPPAIISHVVRGAAGYLGSDASRTVSAAIDWTNTGELPPAEDMPLTQRALARYPSYNVKSIRRFYETMERVDNAAKSIDNAANHQPDQLEATLLRHEQDLPLIELYNDARQQVGDLRRAIQSVNDLKDIGPQTKKQYTDQFLEQIIQITDATNQVAAQVELGVQ